MTYISNLIHHGDCFSLVVVIAILYGIGTRMVDSHPLLRLWGTRIAVAVFVVFVVADVAEAGSPTAHELLWAVLCALLAAGLAVGPAWIILAIAGFLHGNLKRAREEARTRADQRRKWKEDRQRQRKARRRQTENQQREPGPEQTSAEEEALRLAEQEVSRRRENARVSCELLYNLYAPDLTDRLPKETFQDFVGKYMGEDQPIDIVEERAAQLQTMIQQHYEQVNPPEKLTDLGRLVRWYEKQKKKIERLNVDPSYKEDYLVQLNERYADLTQRLLEKLEP